MITDQDTSRVETEQSQHINTDSSQTVILNPNDYSPEQIEGSDQQPQEDHIQKEAEIQPLSAPEVKDVHKIQPLQPPEDVPEWFMQEGVEGTGNKPEHLLEKFKTVDDQLKSYVELEKKLGAFTGAPEEYALNLGEEYSDVNLETDDPFLQEFAGVASDLNISQDGFDTLLNTYVEFASKEMKSFEESQDALQTEEMSKLGADAEEQKKVLTQWIENQIPKEMQESILNLGVDAESIKALQWFKEQIRSKNMPMAENTTGSLLGTRLELQDMMRDSKYGMDSAFTKIVDDGYARLLGK